MKETIYFAGGCFWGAQRFFDQFEGVVSTEVGYANGPTKDPTYEEVCNDSGHAETVKVVYDNAVITLDELIGYYFRIVDPVSVNRQGGDEGIQYRTGIYYTDNSQLQVINKRMDELEAKLGQKSAIEVLELQNFYTAEEYHQKYLVKNPDGYCHIPAAMFELFKNKE